MPQQRFHRSRTRSDLVRLLRGGMEAVVLGLCVLTPWAFGGVDPMFEFVLASGLSLLLVLWAAVMIASGRFTFTRCPVTLVLALLFLVGLVQLLPLPPGLLPWISPGAGQIRADFFPASPEQLTTDVTAAGAPSWATISVYPHATRMEMFRWLSVLILFAAVRNQVASTGSLWRLSLVMLVNGILLAVFGLVQFFANSEKYKHVVYGIKIAGEPFGPFINRNHYAAYLNLCISLGVGLLVWLGPSEQDTKQRYMVKPIAPEEHREVAAWLMSPFAVLHSPAQLWTLVGLGLMLAALLCSLSRAGVAVMFVAMIATACLRLTWPPRIRRMEALIIPFLLVIGLFAWVGFRPLESRLGSLFKSPSAVADTRLPMWMDLMHLAPRFWLLGSGYGTLGYVEPLTRSPETFPETTMFVDHAHNEFLEALIEGGIVRAGLSFLLVGLIFSAGFRGLRRYLGRTPGALAVGAMTGFLAIALHSVVDFSLSTPAVAVLATVVVAQLVALNRPDPTKPPSDDHVRSNTMSLGVAGAAAVGLTALALGGMLVIHAWQADRVHRLKMAAFRAVHKKAEPAGPDTPALDAAGQPLPIPEKKSDPANYEKALAYLDAAAAIAPDDAEIQSEIGQANLDWGKEDATQGKTVPALWNFAKARELCPLLPRPHMRFAAHAKEILHADPPGMYWDRALKLAPFDPDLWYFAGVQRLQDGKPGDTWRFWRTSLDMFPRRTADEQRRQQHLIAMIVAAAPQLGNNPRTFADQLMKNILPDRPEDLFTAAQILDKNFSPTGPARPLLDRALTLLADRPEGLSAEQYHLKARIAQAVDEPKAAIRAYIQAIRAAPPAREIAWRIEYVNLLKDQRQWKDAQRELIILHAKKPDDTDIKDSLEEVERQMKINPMP